MCERVRSAAYYTHHCIPHSPWINNPSVKATHKQSLPLLRRLAYNINNCYYYNYYTILRSTMNT